MKRRIIIVSWFLGIVLAGTLTSTIAGASGEEPLPETGWQSPPQEWLDVLHAPRLPSVWTSPTGQHLLLADRVYYPPLAELAAPKHELAGLEVNPVTNGYHGRHGGTSPRLVHVDDGTTLPLALPEDAEVLGVNWTVDGQSLALTVVHEKHIGLWIASVTGKVKEIPNLSLNPLMGSAVRWLPDQERLLVCRIPERGPAPEPPIIPAGPKILEGEGTAARSTYEARNLLKTAHDDALFEYYATCELVVIDPDSGNVEPLGTPDIYTNAIHSPDGHYLLIERLVKPWSHEVGYRRFASIIEIWNESGDPVAEIARLPLADQVPVHGVPLGARSVEWQSTEAHTLFWVEALDGGDPVAKVPFRDRYMRLDAPFTDAPTEIFRAEHRIIYNAWGEQDGLLMLVQRERMKRRYHVWLLDVDKGTSRLWYDYDMNDRYGDPGSPVWRALPNGYWVMRQKGQSVYFRGAGATPEGSRPFLDLRDVNSREAVRLFRSPPDRYEAFITFAGDEEHFILRSESATEVPNFYLATLGGAVDADAGEATRAVKRKPITQFEDPAPQLREIETRIVTYERADGVPLNFQLYLPPGYKKGERLPTVLYAYPREYASAATAGQVSGSTQTFLWLGWNSHLFFLLDGYAVLDRTTMPMIGDPETVYDTFVEQLVADAEAAVAKAVEIGVADPERIGIIGHSHGGLMVANLLAHSDLFAAGIARSGSYNKTNQPFGFQRERRSLFEARDVYINVSPVFFADQVDEPVLILHGDADSNPGTLTFQSEVFFEAVRGSGGTARLVLLPFEDHGYSARESTEQVLWEQRQWFNKYVKGE